MAPPLPLSSRRIDLLIALWFVVFFLSTSFTDLHNFVASLLGVPVDRLESMELVYPPKALTALYFRWARSVDPLLYMNPTWWQAIEWVNMLCLTPFAIVATVGVLRGSGWMRIPAVRLDAALQCKPPRELALLPPYLLQIVVSSFTFYSLILCIGTTLYGDTPSQEPATFVGIYQLYLVFPAVVVVRLWRDEPFARPLPAALEAALAAAGSATFAVFFSYVLKWMAMHVPDAFPPTWLPAALDAARSLP